MCGFAGFLRFHPIPKIKGHPSAFLVKMGNAISHRGPDEQVCYEDEYLSIVYCRLSIIDIANGRQPFHSQNHALTLVANGEIYNHDELKKGLQKHRFKSQSDCETILHLFEERGAGAFSALDGMFSIALWHQKNKQLYLARDRLGIKPLYYSQTQTGILFGSELKALLAHPDCPKQTDFSRLDTPLCTEAPCATFIEGIDHVPAATYLTVSPNQQIITTPYWSIEPYFNQFPYGNNPWAYIEAFNDLLEKTVKSHLQGESPVATQLSGGIDSSLLTCIASRYRSDISCVSLIERSNFFSHDLNFAKEVISQTKCPWYPLLVDYQNIIADSAFSLAYLESLVWMMDAPRFDLEWMLKERAHAFLKANQPQTKVVLIGQGADEFTGGYSKRVGTDFKSFADYLALEGRQMVTATQTNPRAISANTNYFELMSCFIRQLQMHNLWHEDRTSSAHGLEARVPFLDHKLIELLASIPESLHEVLFWDKHLLRETARRQIPTLPWSHPKLGFVYGADARSIDLIKTQLVLKVLPEFLEKYEDRFAEEGDALKLKVHIEQMRNNDGSQEKHADALLQLITKSIFKEQVSGPQTTEMPCTMQKFESSLPRIQPTDWPLIEKKFEQAPFNEFLWSQYDIPCFAPGGKGSWAIKNAQADFLFITQAEQTISLSFPLAETWMVTFLKHLGKGIAARFTVEEWLEELEIEETQFIQRLNILTSAGILQYPVIHAPHLQ